MSFMDNKIKVEATNQPSPEAGEGTETKTNQQIDVEAIIKENESLRAQAAEAAAKKADAETSSFKLRKKIRDSEIAKQEQEQLQAKANNEFKAMSESQEKTLAMMREELAEAVKYKEDAERYQKYREAESAAIKESMSTLSELDQALVAGTPFESQRALIARLAGKVAKPAQGQIGVGRTGPGIESKNWDEMSGAELLSAMEEDPEGWEKHRAGLRSGAKQ